MRQGDGYSALYRNVQEYKLGRVEKKTQWTLPHTSHRSQRGWITERVKIMEKLKEKKALRT